MKKSDRQKTKEEILDQLYVSAEDLTIIIPHLSIGAARKIITETRNKMVNKYLIPDGKPYLALTKIIRKDYGF